MAVRPADAGDVEGFLDVFESVAAEGRWIGAEAPIDRAAAAASFRWRLESPSAAVFVAADEGAVVGWVKLDITIGIADLGMAIVDGYRGHGIGTRLMTEAVDWSRRAGAHKLHLSMWPWNDRAHALYLKFGFRDEGLLRRHYRRSNGELWDALVMGLVLDEDSPGADPE